MRFSHPEYLLLFCLVAWCWASGRRFVLPGDWRGRAAMRATAAALLVLAAAGLEVRGSDEPLSVMVLLDRSDSMRAAGSTIPGGATLGAARPGDRAGIIVFGADAVLERRLAAPQPVRDVSSQVTGSATNLAAAIRLARATLPAGGSRRMVLVSDGRETVDDAAAEAVRAAADGVSIDVVAPAPADASHEPQVLSLTAPASVRAGEAFVLTADVAGPPGSPVEVVLRGERAEPVSRTVVVGQTGRGAAVFQDRPRQAGLHTYVASAGAAGDLHDTAPRESAGAVVAVAGETNLLYISDGRGMLGPGLMAHGIRVSHSSPTAVPSTANALAQFDVLVLDDVPLSALDSQQAEAVARHVEHQGGGLLVLGSSRTLEPGAHTAGPLARVLPVDLRPRAGSRAASAAVVVVFDKSGSMSDEVQGVPKIEIARQAVRRVLDVLPGSDALGVIAFDAVPVDVAPLAAQHDSGRLSSALRELAPGGATRIAPAIRRAGEWLRSATAARFTRRHILLVSDGRSTAEDRTELESLLPELGAELSVVALGAQSDTALLSRMAAVTGGRAHFPSDLRQLPVLLAREAARVAGGRTVDERFRVRTSAHAVTGGLERYGDPVLNGYVVGALRPSSETVLTSHLGDPILATWQIGLGRTGVYTADLHGAWSRPLRTWAGFGPLWIQTVRWLARSSEAGPLRARFEADGNHMRIVVDAETEDERFINGLTLLAHVRPPSSAGFEMTLSNVAPGRYSARIPLAEAGTYAVALTAPGRREGGRLLRGFYWSAAAERLNGPPDRDLLGRLASMTGGRLLTADQSVFDAPRGAAYIELWPWLTGVAALLFVLEVVLPRLTRTTSTRPRFAGQNPTIRLA